MAAVPPFAIGSDRPFLAERQLVAFAEIVLEHGDGIEQPVLAVGSDLGDHARELGMKHDAVLDDRSLGKGGVDLTALEPVAGLDLEGDRPEPVGVERADGSASGDERAGLRLDRL